jgi:hypothetical protein
MKAILNPDGTFRGLVTDDTATDETRTRAWVPTAAPAAEPGMAVMQGPPTVGETTVTQTWVQVPLALSPITKLTLKTRVTPQEWGAIKAAIAGASEDTQEDWVLAKEIDPAHPQTAGMIAALQGAGYLTTPLHVIFAP